MSFIKTQVSKKDSFFQPKFPEKYKGKWPIIMRSQWERTFAQWCDVNPSVLSWVSEGLEIPYYDPIKRKSRRYYPDFMVKVLDKNKKEVIYVIEIKPLRETIPPKKGNKSDRTKIHEQVTYVTNQAKWKAAIDFCKKRNYEFRIFTENELFGGKR